MSIPKSITTVTAFSKMLAAFLFILFPLVGFRFGMSYQKSIDIILNDVQNQYEKKKMLRPTPTPTTVSSPNKMDWYRYMSDRLDYYFDYPKNFKYEVDAKSSAILEKKVPYLHRLNNHIFIDREESPQFSQTKIDELKQMIIGETKVISKNESSLPSKFKTYERLPDVYFGDKNTLSFVNKDVWEAGEGTSLYLYIYEGKDTYIFGGLTNDSKDGEDNISYSEFKEIISTLRFLD